MYQIRKLFRFEASHRLTSSYSKCCQAIHGHSYLVEVFLLRNELNDDGMVMDFGILKDQFGPIVKEWDHKMIVSTSDPFLDKTHGNNIFNNNIVYVDFNPTAENMAKYLYDKLVHIVGEYNRLSNANVQVARVRVHETTTGWAEYSVKNK